MTNKKTIRNAMTIITILFILTGTAIFIIGKMQDSIKDASYKITINPNMKVKQFESFVNQLKNITKPDDNKLYDVNNHFEIHFDKNKNILNFSLGFAVFNNGKPIHYQIKSEEKNPMKLNIEKAYEISLDNKDAVKYKDFSNTIKLLDKVPWDHLESNISVKDYSYLGVNSFIIGDGSGNIRLDSAPKGHSFEVDKNGNISKLIDTSIIPYNSYNVLSFFYSNATNGQLDLIYYYKN